VPAVVGTGRYLLLGILARDMPPEIAVVGAGTIGSTVAYTLATAHGLDVRLIDTDGDLAGAQAADIRHAGAHTVHPVGAGLPGGSVEAVDPGPAAPEGVDCVVVAASIQRPSETTQRLDFLEGNREVIDEIAAWLVGCEPRPVVVVSNPVDHLTYRLWRRTGWPRERFVGYSLSETARMAAIVARREGVPADAVSVPILGEHGDHMVPAFSRATVDGDPYRPPEDLRDELLAATKRAPIDIMDSRGFEETSRWVSGRGVALLARSIAAGGPAGAVCLSTPLEGAYGEADVSMSVPVTLGSDGVTGILEWDLAPGERAGLSEAAESIRSALVV